LLKTRSFHWAWVILIICFINLFINYSVRLGYGVILPEMIRDLGFSRTAGGSIYNAYLMMYIVFTPLAGYLTDRIGARSVISICLSILGIGTVLMGTVRDLSTSCLFFGIAGLGACGMWTPVITLVQQWYDRSKRGLALGVLSTGYGAGFATIGLIFPVVVHLADWRYAWYVMGSAALSMVVFNALLLRSSPESAGTRPWGHTDYDRSRDAEYEVNETRRPPLNLLRAVFQNKTFWIIGMSYFSVSYSLYGFTTFMIDYARTQLMLPLEQSSLLATVHGIGQAVGVLLLLPLSDYWGRKRTLLFSNFMITITLAGILLMDGSTGLLFVLVGIMALFHGATWPMYGACAGDYFPREIMGTVIGAWTPFYGMGAITAHWIGGVLRDMNGTYTQAFTINTIMAVAAFMLMCAVTRHLYRDG
jgi:sugar phosphate permease